MQTAQGCQDMCALVFVIMAEMASCPSLSVFPFFTLYDNFYMHVSASMILQRALFHFLWLSNIPLCTGAVAAPA